MIASLRKAALSALGFALLTSSAAHASEPQVEGAAVDAVWSVQTLDFRYRGTSVSYSCDSLNRRVQQILVAVGARPDSMIRTWACEDLRGSPRLQITMSVPIEATAQNIRAVTSYDATQMLLARLHERTLPTAQDIDVFAAEWRTISLARDKQLKLEPGDCELVKQLRSEVLPRMSVRVLHENLRCSSPGLARIGKPQLTVAALVQQRDAGDMFRH